MSFNENFDTGTGNYTLDTTGTDPGYVTTDGFPALGCCGFKMSVVVSHGLRNDVDDLTVTSGMKFWFYYKAIDCDDVADTFELIRGSIAFDLSATVLFSVTGAEVNSANTGWVLKEVTIPVGHVGDNIYAVDLRFGDPPAFDPNGVVYVDTFLLDPNPPPLGGGSANRLWVYKTLDGGQSWTSRGVKT